jgi:hypothetical protein
MSQFEPLGVRYPRLRITALGVYERQYLNGPEINVFQGLTRPPYFFQTELILRTVLEMVMNLFDLGSCEGRGIS